MFLIENFTPDKTKVINVDINLNEEEPQDELEEDTEQEVEESKPEVSVDEKTSVINIKDFHSEIMSDGEEYKKNLRRS